jgi:cell division protein FtsZ
MSNQIRVTVVATGLGRPTVRQQAHTAQPQMRVVAQRGRGPLSGADYAALDKPTVQRQRAVGDGIRGGGEGEDLLDIPAFLRRQAD